MLGRILPFRQEHTEEIFTISRAWLMRERESCCELMLHSYIERFLSLQELADFGGRRSKGAKNSMMGLCPIGEKHYNS